MPKINYYGTYTLYVREVKRFLRVYHQTIIAPIISALIFLCVFAFALGGSNKVVHGIPYLEFAGYGLIIMTIIQNSFANSSSSLMMARMIGYVTDILMTPFDGIELVTAYTLGSVTRGFIIGFFLSIILSFIIEFRVYNLWIVCGYTLLACILMSNLGTLSSLVTDNVDKNSAITNYIIAPLSFLSGTFYSIHDLPFWAQIINYVNPFFYIIDGFRFGLAGIHDGNLIIGFLYLLFLDLVIIFATIKIFNSGWKLKP